MKGLIAKPDSPWSAFFQGVGTTAIAVGIPVVGGTLIMAAKAGEIWRGLGIGFALSLVACLVAGLACAGWRLLQLWAYDRITGDPLD